jgi:hypothetical protein
MANTSLIGLTLPTQGTLSGTWGDTVNNAISQIVDVAVAGTQTITTDADINLAVTTGTNLTTGLTANSSQYAILLCTGARTALRYINTPKQSKIYVVINDTTGGYAVTVRGGPTSPTTGITVAAGTRAIIAWDGGLATPDFVNVGGGSAAGSNTQVQFNSSGAFGASSNLTWNGTTLTSTGFGGPLNGTVGATTPAAGAFTTVTTTSAIAYNYGGTGQTSAFTQYGITYASTTSALATTAAGTTGQVLTATTGGAPTWAAPAASGVSQAKATMLNFIFSI